MSNDTITFDLERSISRSHGFQRLMSRKAVELGHILLLNTNRKSYIGSPKPSSHLTLSDLERSKLRCRIWSKLDTCIVRYCVRVNPDFNWFSLQQWVFDTSLQKLPMSSQLQLSSRAPRSLDLLLSHLSEVKVIWRISLKFYKVCILVGYT